jgi:hypothetical protein
MFMQTLKTSFRGKKCSSTSEPSTTAERETSMKKMTMLGLAAILVACGGGGGTDQLDQFDEGPPPSDEVLCQIIIGQSTRAQVENLLGEPASIFEDSQRASAQYTYGNWVEGPAISLFIEYDRGIVDEHVSVHDMPFPRCWAEQLEALQVDASEL